MPTLIRPAVVFFDVIETTFRIEPLGDALAKLGLPREAYARLYAEALRDAVSLACLGRFAPFVEVFTGALGGILAEAGLSPSPGEVQDALATLAELPPHSDAAEAYAALKDGGIRVIPLSNGAESSTRKLLERAGMSGSVETVLSVEAVRLAKPRPEVYRHALAAAGIAPGRAMLVACHPWDVTGAKAAGLLGGYVARGKPYPAVMEPPDLSRESLGEVARAILALPAT